VLILGAHGMLGGLVTRVLAGRPELHVSATARSSDNAGPEHRFDAQRDPLGPLLDGDDYDWIVNAIGVLNARIDNNDAGSIEDAITINALFPHRLAKEAAARGQKVIEIATDGVYSGANGPYDESAEHDPRDVYGKTKSLGEVSAGNVWRLRCSIIGPELSTPSSLLGSTLAAAPGAELTGYDGHLWNGITTLHFARLCAAVIAGVEAPRLQHIVPGDSLSKATLLELILQAFDRTDVTVRHVPGPGAPVDRTLRTSDPAANERLWSAAGYERPPTIATMLAELAAAQAEDSAAAS